MNPAKRKKLYRLELTKTKVVEEKVIQKEEKEVMLPKEEPKLVIESAIQQEATEQLPQLEAELKTTDTLQASESVQNLDYKKDKKKKTSSQEA